MKARSAIALAGLAAGALWTLPNTFIGLVVGLAGCAAGSRVRWRADAFAIEFFRWPWGPGGAITFGNCIVHSGETLDAPCGMYGPVEGCGADAVEPRFVDHERAHVFQYMLLGPLFLPIYLACGGISARNPFERAADRYAVTGKGWWPLNIRRRPA